MTALTNFAEEQKDSLTVDERGDVRALDTKTWLERRERLGNSAARRGWISVLDCGVKTRPRNPGMSLDNGHIYNLMVKTSRSEL
jgi:hypothetical protein